MMSQAQKERGETHPGSKSAVTAVKGRKRKDGPQGLSTPTLKVCTLQWTFLHDLGQVTEAKPKLLDPGWPWEPDLSRRADRQQSLCFSVFAKYKDKKFLFYFTATLRRCTPVSTRLSGTVVRRPHRQPGSDSITQVHKHFVLCSWLIIFTT